jgi:hypothetical protein
MATSRYSFVPKILGRKLYGTSTGASRIFFAVDSGALRYNTIILKENQRLDHIAAQNYGSSGLWWIIAAASGIGWGLQVPPGTIIKIPTDTNLVFELLR